MDVSGGVRVSCRKLSFDLQSKDWVTKQADIQIPHPSKHFDAGGMRLCFFVQEYEEDGTSMPCVAKFFKSDIPDVVYADYLNEAMAQCLSEEFAQNFNKLDTPKKISFLNCDVVVVDKRDVPPEHLVKAGSFFSFRTQDTNEVVFCMEPRLTGDFTKYNSNFGDTYANNKRDRNHQPTALDSVFISAEAFSHFTLQESGGSMLVCDLQGVEDLLTDPQIHTEEGKGLGMGNMGEEGIEKWAQSHKCNEVCTRLRLKPVQQILAENRAPPPPPIQTNQGGNSSSHSLSSGPGTPEMPVNPQSAHKSSGHPSGTIPPRPPGSWDSVAGTSEGPGSWSRYQDLTHSMMESMRRNGLRMSQRPPVAVVQGRPQQGQQSTPTGPAQQPTPHQPFPFHAVGAQQQRPLPATPNANPNMGQQQQYLYGANAQGYGTPLQQPPQGQGYYQASQQPYPAQHIPQQQQRPSGAPGTFLPPPTGAPPNNNYYGYQPGAGTGMLPSPNTAQPYSPHTPMPGQSPHLAQPQQGYGNAHVGFGGSPQPNYNQQRPLPSNQAGSPDGRGAERERLMQMSEDEQLRLALERSMTDK
jgi:myosin-heavy-chain kinase